MYPGRQGPLDPPGSPGPVRPVIVQQPQVTLDTTALENMFGTVGQSMLQLARAQDQTDIYNNIYNKGNSICRLIQELYNNLPHQHTNVIVTIYLPVYQSMMEVTEKVSIL